MTGVHITRVDVPDADRVRVQYRSEDGKRRQVTLRKSEGAGILAFGLDPFILTLAVKRLYETYPFTSYAICGHLVLPVLDLKVPILNKLLKHLPRVTL